MEKGTERRLSQLFPALALAKEQYRQNLSTTNRRQFMDSGEGLYSIGEDEDYNQSNDGASATRAKGPFATRRSTSPRQRVELMVKKESEAKIGVTQGIETNHKPALRYHRNDSKNQTEKAGRKTHASPFGKVAAQTLSTAIRSRLVLKNSYGMPKETMQDFRQPNLGEAKRSMLRDHKRDPASVLHDSETLRVLHEDKKQKSSIPTLKSLKLKGSFVSARGPGRGRMGRSTKEVAFDLESVQHTAPTRKDSSAYRAEPSSPA